MHFRLWSLGGPLGDIMNGKPAVPDKNFWASKAELICLLVQLAAPVGRRSPRKRNAARLAGEALFSSVLRLSGRTIDWTLV